MLLVSLYVGIDNESPSLISSERSRQSIFGIMITELLLALRVGNSGTAVEFYLNLSNTMSQISN